MIALKSLLLLFPALTTINALIIKNCIKDKDVALTFEDGPSIKTTKNLLDLLDSLKVKATFHVVTKHFNYVQVQELMSDIINRGHVLGYRLEAEWTMQDVSTEGIQGAVDYRLEMIKKACGKKPKFVRTSYNATELVKNALLASNLILTVPNFETYDYKKDFDIKSMLDRFDSSSLGSVITVQREFANELFETTKAFVEHLRSKNYNIVTLQECTGIDGIYFDQKGIPKLVTPDIPTENNSNNSSSQESTSTATAFKSSNLGLAIVIISTMLILL